MLAALVAGEGAPASSPSATLPIIEGEAAKIDLQRRELVVRVKGTRSDSDEKEPSHALRGSVSAREVAVAIDEAGTRITRAGRVLRLEDVRAGDRILALCGDRGTRHCEARLVKVGTWRRVDALEPGRRPRE